VSSQIGVAVRILGAILLVGLAVFCGYGFLASYELGFPIVWHSLYGVVGAVAVMAAVCLISPFLQWMMTGIADPPWTNYWRLYRLTTPFSLLSVFAFMTGHFVYLSFLGFLLFLLPIPLRPRAQP
jgi:hypothetical protein